MPDQSPTMLSRAAASVLSFLERKAAPALAHRHSAWGGSGGSSGAWWGDGRSASTAFLAGLPGDDRDVAADAGDLWLNSAVAACISWLADQFNEPEFRVTALNRKTGDYEAYATHELVDRLEDPNGSYDADALWAATVLSWQVDDGGAYWVKSRAKSGKVLELWFVPSFEMSPVWPDDGSAFISGYRHTVDGRPYDLPVEDVIHFRRGLNPANLRAGLAPLGTVIREVATDNGASAYEAAILRNMGIIPILVQPAEPGDTFAPGQAGVLRDQFQAGTTGANRGRVVVPSARVDVKQFGLSPKDMDLGGIRNIPEDRICAATGVNAMVVGLSSGALHKTYKNLAEATRAAYNRALIPMQRSFARTLTRQLLWSDFGGRRGIDYCEWNYDEVAALSEDATNRVTRAVAAFEARLIKRGEACEIAGLNPPDPEFDVYLEQPSVENARAWAAVDDDPQTDPNAAADLARSFGKPSDRPPPRLTPAAVDDPVAPGGLRIAKALAAIAEGKVSANGHYALADSPGAPPEREDDDDPFSPPPASTAGSSPGLKATATSPSPPAPFRIEPVAADLASPGLVTALLVEGGLAAGRRLAGDTAARIDLGAAFVAGTLTAPASRKLLGTLRADGMARFRTLAGRLVTKAVDLPAWSDTFQGGVAKLVSAGFHAVARGQALTEAMTAAYRAAATRQLGYVERFRSAIVAGAQLLDGTVASRAALYAAAAWGAAVNGEREARGHAEEMRVLGESDHCGGCLAEAARGWQPAGTLLAIGETECKAQCTCYFEYRGAA